MTLNERINHRAALVKWANDTHRFLVSSISNKGLVESGNLRKSVKHEIYGLTTQVRTFVFRFSLHGMFVDMGVFGGKSLEDSKNDKLSSRLLGLRSKRNSQLKNRTKKQYMWYSRTMYGSINYLNQILLAEYGDKYVQSIELPEIIEI